MSTVNFSVPEEIKKAFDKTFAGKNKSQIIAHLMQEAIEEQHIKKRRVKAVEAILKIRKTQKSVSMKKILAARNEWRK